jgi:bacteriocin biosynthesis cyclodehydratase domain-containing protein
MAVNGGSREPARAGPHTTGAARYVLRADLELFEAPDGDLYLLGHDEDHVVAQPGLSERQLLKTLAQRPMTRQEMLQLLATQAGEAQASKAVDDFLASDLLRVCEGQSGVQLSPAIAQRYDRQLAYFSQTRPGAEHRLQHRLRQATVVIVGLGGLGSWSAATLACIGIGKLVLVDDDHVELSNLSRQVLFRPDDIGKPKVDVAAAALRAFNPDLELHAHSVRIRDRLDLRKFLTGASLLVATADWPPYRISRWINEACVRAGIPYISAGQVPPYVRIGPTVIPGVTGCFECGERDARGRFPYYDQVAAQRERTETRAATLGPTSAMVGAMIGTDILHCLTGTSRPATQGRSVTVDTRSWRTSTREVKRDPSCRVCGRLGAAGQA